MSDPLEKALSLLPHGPEFRFLDRLISLEPGENATAEFTVRDELPFLRGHFPGNPLLPGVLLVEATAQLVGILAQSNPQCGLLPDLKLTAIRSAKILGAVRPGETITISAKIAGRLGNLIQGQGCARLNGTEIFRCDVTLSSG